MLQRNLGAIHVAALLVSASYGVAFLLGSGEMALHAGMAGSLYAIVTALGMLGLALAAPTLWRGRELIWDVFGERYGPVVRRLVALLSLVWMSGVLAAQIHGGIAVLVATGLPATHALVLIAAALLVMSCIELGIAAVLFACCLLATNIALVHALAASGGLPVYLHAWPSFIAEICTAPRAGTLVTIAAVGFLVITGSDYQQFAIAARRPRDAWLGCVLASLFLMVTGFLPAATVVAALRAGKLYGLSETASAIPWIMLQTSGAMGMICIGVILLAALGSGTAITRAMSSALEGLYSRDGRHGHASDGHHGHASRVLIVAIGCAIATDGQAIVSTIVSLNVVYVAAVGLLFLLHETGRRVAPRCASWMLLSGAATSLLVSSMNWTDIGNLPAWLPLPAGLLASACVLAAWRFTRVPGRARS
ncbi:SSS family solute:Na+ symporter [Paraburkholderia sp. BL23I1N1]|uniref:sodium:solute symporter n=1 Tax=unclassified Paraburkholderia TaxID=2615204 RepID=UPI000E243888|nr:MULTISPECIES: sodium:solute symporter [unclassified Paraburkholderia]REE18587.1 SSS family solute:Na+ symporter [Paraburkholderia sp. BL27I4N3]RKE35601.1 SSS family solute:Na+ symporter [Paraburkholderia sp. BL23I1N1]